MIFALIDDLGLSSNLPFYLTSMKFALMGMMQYPLGNVSHVICTKMSLFDLCNVYYIFSFIAFALELIFHPFYTKCK